MRTAEEIVNEWRTNADLSFVYMVKLAQTEAYNEGHANGYNEGRYQLDYMAKRNYAATVRRGLITPETRIPDFIRKIIEEERELIESWNTYESTFDPTELADIALVCFAMAQHYGIDLIDEMRKKVEFNEQRQD